MSSSMAGSGHDDSRRGAGIRIDSSLITTASSDVQSELQGLGVSVYNQEEFEAGVMRQIDREVSRRNAEQKRKFLLKEYSNIRQEISSVRIELSTLSKTIAGLLCHPLCDIVIRLRELKASQEQKRKQLQTLEGREQQLLKKLSGRDEEEEEDVGGGPTQDVAFGIPLESADSEQQRLIQTGQLTPFGGRVGDTRAGKETGNSTNLLGEPSRPGSSVGEVNSITQEAPLELGGRDGLPGVSVETGGKPVEENGTITPGGLRLSSDSFDGLFADLPRLLKRKSATRVSRDKGKGKGKAVVAETSTSNGPHSSRVVARDDSDEEMLPNFRIFGVQTTSTGSVGQSAKNDASFDKDGSFADDEYLPDQAELREALEEIESDATEYFTDEEMGGAEQKGGQQRGRRRRRRRRKLRELSSGESDDDLVVTNWPKKRKVSSRKPRRYQDDGDQELYRLRIRHYEEQRVRRELEGDLSDPDMVFKGGLRIPGVIWHKLYGYQQTGVKWLWELHCQQAGGIVGDEMGLGKTIEMIAFLAGLQVSKLRSHVTRRLGLGPVLIVCPATVMHQWVSEFHTWWAPFRVAVLHETGTFSGDKRVLVDRTVTGSGVLITTYAGIRLYRDLLLRHRWDYLILDEGHKIRNPDAEITLACKQFATPHRLILSGSPMQNNLRELWSLFDFVFPGKLGTLPVFMEQFSVPITIGGYANATEVQVQTAYRCACVLRDTINPYLLRRLKADVKIQLPNKNEQVLFCRLTDYQRELYEDFVRSPEVEAMLCGRRLVFSGLMTLRKLCNHPDLVTNDYCKLAQPSEGAEGEGVGGEREIAMIDVSKKARRRKRMEAVELEAAGESEEVYGYWRRSGKMAVVESLLKLWNSQGHRVLLFSQSKQMLDILGRFLCSRGYSYVRMDGGTTIASRQPLIARFNEDPSIFVFLLTTRVGGLGVNLTGADRVLIYDPDWNPSTDIQARERAWRIGQKRQVTIYRLLTSGTIEEKIYHRQIFKQFLTNRVLKDPRQRRFFKSNDLFELFTLGSSASEGSTETSAIFAGTGSEVVPKQRKKQRSRDYSSVSHDLNGKISLADSKRKSHDQSTTPKKKKRSPDLNAVTSLEEKCADDRDSESPPAKKLGTKLNKEKAAESKEASSLGHEVEVRDDQTPGIVPDVVLNKSGEDATRDEDHIGTPAKSSLNINESGCTEWLHDRGSMLSTADQDKPNVDVEVSSFEMEPEPEQESVMEPGPSSSRMECRLSSGMETRHKHKHKKKKKDKRSKRSQRNTRVDGMEIVGLERTSVFSPGDQDELNSRQDDYILRKLFKKSGVHSALQHDTIMDSGDPDYVLVESEARKVAQSAARAVKESRRQCLGAGWGQPTWTGQHGVTGALKPRFGAKGLSSSSVGKQASAKHFDGKASSSLNSQSQGSINTSSSELLAKMRSRNAHTLPGGSSGLHQGEHSELVREIRDFIATQCKVDGQASTGEILGRFANRLPTSDAAVFRSMLCEICDFSRHRGEGLWSLKPEFR